MPDELSWSEIVRIADLAMYIAKNSGRNAWVGLRPGPKYEPIGWDASIVSKIDDLIKTQKIEVFSSLANDRPLIFASGEKQFNLS